ncbi:MAG: 30S ribosomal protein S20 [Alphaproteobacteria bacterium]|nr:30S ribosomal protein S20 [Alphaproteobacteria bacterium]MBN2675167.1 30S ribosomal protein S20 [Alphaproteobacteria bacterium]
MANHKSAKKRILVTAKKNAVNTARRSSVKTVTKKAVKAIESNDKAAAIVLLRDAESKIMKAAKKIMPKKRASRKISRMTKKANKIA